MHFQINECWSAVGILSHRVTVVLLVEEVGHSDHQLVVAVSVDVANRGVAQDVRVHEDEALLAGVRRLEEGLVLPQVVLRDGLQQPQLDALHYAEC